MAEMAEMAVASSHQQQHSHQQQEAITAEEQIQD
jgi:hypothetical protein